MEAAAIRQVPQKPGANPVRRAAQQNAVRLGRGGTPGVAAIGLGRFRPLKFESKLGINIYSKLQILTNSGLGTKAKNIDEIYQDLLPCFARYYELYHGHKNTEDLLAQSNGDAAHALQKWFFLLNGMLGESINYTIEQDANDVFYIKAFQEAQYREQWNIIQVGPVLKKLNRWYPEMCKQFIDFLAAFSRTGIEYWWEGNYGYHTTDVLVNTLEENDGLEADYKRALRREIERYNSGIAYGYEKRIMAAHEALVARMAYYAYLDDGLTSLKKVKGCAPIKRVIRAGIKLMKLDKKIQDFGWYPGVGDYYDEGLKYEDSNHIIWDVHGMAQEMFQEWIDAEAGEGLRAPHQTMIINSHTSAIFKPDDWPIKLNDFFDLACDEINKFTTPKKKPNGPAK